jgi:hypothetical protein
MTALPVSRDELPHQAAGGAILMPAHNEGAVIARSLARLLDGLDPSVRVVVVCNGCTDNTAEVARTMGPRVEVLELAQASKPAAIRAGEHAVPELFPRLYLDADVDLTGAAANATLRRLREGAPAARPTAQLDLQGASGVIGRYYRAWSRLPRTSERLWGAGVYGLSREGRNRFGAFPDVVADDLFVDELFRGDEISIVQTEPVIARVPRTVRAQLRMMRRSRGGNVELVSSGRAESTTWMTLRAAAASATSGPCEAVDAAVYLLITLAGRASTRLARSGTWERDESSRVSLSP